MTRPTRTASDSSPLMKSTKSGILSRAASTFSPSVVPSFNSTTSWWKYNYLAILFVVILYLVSIFFSCTSSTNWASTISDLLLVLEVAWTVKFLMTWPTNWTEQLILSKRKLINYVNSIDLAIGNVPNGPETALNYEVAASNLQAAQNLHRYQKYGFLAEFGGVLVSALLFKWTRLQLSAVDGAVGFSEVNIAMFVLWGTFKLSIHLASVVYDESSFDSDTIADGGYVTEMNLDFVARVICERSNAARQTRILVKSSDVSQVPNKEPPHIPAPHIFDNSSISIMPFPLSLSRKLMVFPKASKVRTLAAIQEVIEHDEIIQSPKSARCLAQVSGIQKHIPNPQDNKSLPIQVSHPYSATPGISPVQCCLTDTDESSDVPRALGFFRISMAKIHQYMIDPENHNSIKLFESLYQKTHQSRIKVFDSVWNLWEYIQNFDMHSGFFGLLNIAILHPLKTVIKIFYGVLFLVPFNLVKLVVAIVSFVPRTLIRIFIMAPIYLVVKYATENGNSKSLISGIRDYHVQNGIPVSADHLTQSICRAILARMSTDRNSYAG